MDILIRTRDEDVESLARKLSEFTRALSPGERRAFEALEQAIAAEVDAEPIDAADLALLAR